ncbi:MAG: thioesterase [Chloroflexota bacterium]|nr:thioesterase [Chloroflexota bacterium]
MVAEPRIELPYRVRFDECGPDGNLPSSGFLRYAQDLAWVHADGAGFGRGWYGQRGLTWLIRAVELEILENAAHGETVDASTEVIGFRRVWARRRSEFTRRDSERTLAVAAIDWVLLNAAGTPVRVPRDIIAAFATPPSGTFTPLRIDVPPSPADAARREFAVRRSELDPMAHVNNAAYLDYIDELLVGAGGEGEVTRLPRRYRVEFLAPAGPGMLVRGYGWAIEPAWCYRLESAADGRELVRARVETDPRTWVGG